ncbi:s-adenosylmethionine-dependent methyltransferase [Diplodia corticola]|uniref:Protein-lysine N-methyltransferase EFM4 n=1 Tax=Diplodia corticola TaxID=236234 RepID=A0A1J9S8S5_9PEZI|nr:s-adenosylmethionine-dependent methyltransferase [Diplodia corticola]OJD36316.1 s-adenosylmethionine-dependent methyltransferase [Diplodia corticola]
MTATDDDQHDQHDQHHHLHLHHHHDHSHDQHHAPAHLDPSALGTKAYWDACYEREIANHAERPHDEGTVWFADAGAEERTLAHLDRLADDWRLVKGDDGGFEEENSADAARDCTSFCDLGTGNGHLLFALRDEGWRGRMVGVDYSALSVELARRIAVERARAEGGDGDGDGDGGEDGGKVAAAAADVRFEVWDILGEEPGAEWLQGGFDVVLDKGTFDAISLSAETDAQGRRVFESYREKVEPLIKPGGLLLVTSCNWTADELKAWFVVEGGLLEYEDKIKYPSFTFGGRTGSKVCTLCFKKKSDASA